jgi:phosphoglycolate phosphatase
MKYDLCIFDLDGTLIDTRRDITFAVNQMLLYYGIRKKSVDEVTSYVGDGIVKLVQRCIGSRSIDTDEAVSIFKHSYSEHSLDTTKPYRGVVKLLDRLNGVAKALLTNKSFDLSKTIADGLGLSGYFSIFVGGDTLRRKKPFPDGIDYIMNEIGAVRDRTVMVGDGKTDILTAKKAGITSVYAAYGFTDPENIKGLKPDFTIRNPMELLRVLG